MKAQRETNTSDDSEAPIQKKPNTKNSWYEKYLEATIGAVITIFLVGIVSWTFGHFATKIASIEKNIAAHHGPQWEEMEKVVAVGNLRSEFLKAKADYEEKLSELSKSLKKKDLEIEKALNRHESISSALLEWSEQIDKVVKDSREREYEAYAHLTTHAPNNANVALLNTAHLGGTRFKAGDKVVITNSSSGRREKTTVKIVSAYTDLDNTDVLVQIAQQPAKILGLSKQLGKIKVIVKKDKPDANDPSRWRPLREISANR
ncbi:hypothetical protein [Gilvimarinus algae]|uniref:Uncharacterized protein n=1 Tax=Gilvimarinus algae TaxID=3058037 RepID=A0ABT8TJF1_9GAMM|nr:hypothetical protein [Gilvimarinus sp. SDUM040014]MDO3382467.1 hypothetical protein [Gilvimarinus sp. SDUM040014]